MAVHGTMLEMMMDDDLISANLATERQTTRSVDQPVRMFFVLTAIIAGMMLFASLILAAHHVEPRPGDAISSADGDASTLTENQAYALYRRSI